MDKFKAQDLLKRYSEGNCTEEEQLLIESWYNHQTKDSKELGYEPNWDFARQRIYRNLPLYTKRRRKVSQMFYAAATIVAFVVSIGTYLYLHRTEKSIVFANDLAPGNNKAILTLANGLKINLNAASKGQLARQSNIKITKAGGGQIIYTVLKTIDGQPVDSGAYNTIETPRGGQYEVNLPDGTEVWLDAASSLRYPVIFGLKQRKVELKGEAYFEVAHNKKKPFIVATEQQNVLVLGTHFNINAYPDESTVNTTLLEGKVKITGNGLNAELIPGQQSILTPQTHQIKVQNADLETTMAWKNGDFVFKSEGLESIMRKISRWYDVDVEYASNAPHNLTLGGWVSRSRNISAILKIMETTDRVHFKIEGRRVIVMQ
jgi:transmembrane sensor